ncbi:MAG: hypothetical protein ACREIA_00450 [Opitutaceae bacterium]
MFEVTCPDCVCFVFWSAVVQDSVSYQFPSEREMLDFFEVRFRGIANDLKHGKKREDVTAIGGGDDRSAVLLPLVYSGYANAIDAVRRGARVDE